MKDPKIVRQTLIQRFSIYNTNNLYNITSEELQQVLMSKIGVIGAERERYSQEELGG